MSLAVASFRAPQSFDPVGAGQKGTAVPTKGADGGVATAFAAVLSATASEAASALAQPQADGQASLGNWANRLRFASPDSNAAEQPGEESAETATSAEEASGAGVASALPAALILAGVVTAGLAAPTTPAPQGERPPAQVNSAPEPTAKASPREIRSRPWPALQDQAPIAADAKASATSGGQQAVAVSPPSTKPTVPVSGPVKDVSPTVDGIAQPAPLGAPVKSTEARPRTAHADTNGVSPAGGRKSDGAPQVVETKTHFAPSVATPVLQIAAAIQNDAPVSATPSPVAATTVLAAANASKPAEGPLKTLTIQLQPENLGTVEVRLEVTDGRLAVHIEAHRAETARTIDTTKDVLAASLQSSGYTLDGLTVRAAAPPSAGDGPSGQATAGGQQNPAQGGAMPNGQSSAGSGERSPERSSSARSDHSSDTPKNQSSPNAVSSRPHSGALYL